MKKLIIYGEEEHIFTRTMQEKAAADDGVEVEIIEKWDDLTNRLPTLKTETIVFVNKSESDALAIKTRRPKLTLIMCRGGAKEFQPTMTLVDAKKNHNYFMFQSWEDFWNKILDPPIDFKPLLTALNENNYLINYENYSELKERQKTMTKQNFFWFSIYLSRVYLWWFKKWLVEVYKMRFPFQAKLNGDGKIRRLSIPFKNVYRGEAIFREGEEICFSEIGPFVLNNDFELDRYSTPGITDFDSLFPEKSNQSRGRRNEKPARDQALQEYSDDLRRQARQLRYNDQIIDAKILEKELEAINSDEMKKLREENKSVSGIVISADEENLEIQFSKPVSKNFFRAQKSVKKGGNLLALMIRTYARSCAGYADLSLKDYIYSQENHYYRPEDFLRGYLPNKNNLSLVSPILKLDGRSRVILQDDSQLKALLDIMGPSFVSTIKGPPGTGKTLLASVGIKQFLLQGKTILVSAHSNQGLDNLLEALAEHIDPKRIFRLGNNPNLINSSKVKTWHRHERYRKQVQKDQQAHENQTKKSDMILGSFSEPSDDDLRTFDIDSREIYYENEDIWKLICSGQGIVLGTTINSFQFDRSLSRLFFQEQIISKWDFQAPRNKKETGLNNGEDIGEEIENDSSINEILPKTILKFMAEDNPDGKKAKPHFIIDVGFIDEATKGRFFEFLPIIKAVDSKLILIGDTDQLGNIAIAPDVEAEMMTKIMSQFYPAANSQKRILYPGIENDEKHTLSPLETTEMEIESWFKSFSQGMFYSLITDSQLKSNDLNVNRRSLEKITKLLNYVFDKNLRIGRFNPYSKGKITFLNVPGTETKIKTSYKNLAEASIVSQEVINYFIRQKKVKNEIKLNSLGIIASYRGQVRTIKEKLRNDLLFHSIFSGLITPENIDDTLNQMVNTVDAFQGSERETIIISFVRANEDGQIGFNADVRRIYVALSRARNELIIIGDASTFLKSQDQKIKKIFGRLIHLTQTEKAYGLKTFA